MYVVPSGALFFSASAAKRPPAPGLLSTMTVRPSGPCNLSAISRATVSVEPPGGKPTRMRTGALSCACAPSARPSDRPARTVLTCRKQGHAVSRISGRVAVGMSWAAECSANRRRWCWRIAEQLVDDHAAAWRSGRRGTRRSCPWRRAAGSPSCRPAGRAGRRAPWPPRRCGAVSAGAASRAIAAAQAMDLACSSAISMSATRCCSTWNFASGAPNCLRVFRCSAVSVDQRLDRARGLGAERGARARRRPASISAYAPPTGPTMRSASMRTSFNVTCAARRPSSVSKPCTVSARRRGVEREDREAVAVPSIAGGARHDEQQAGRVAVQHQRLAAVQHVAVVTPVGARLHVGQVVARVSLGQRQRDLQLAGWRPSAATALHCAGVPACRSAGRPARRCDSHAPPPSTRPSSCATSISSTGPCPLPPSSASNGKPEQAQLGHAGPALRRQLRRFRDCRAGAPGIRRRRSAARRRAARRGRR